MRPASTISRLPSSDALQASWQQLNVQYFSGSLPPITILWSRRLTSSVGMFTSRGGPRASGTHRNGRQIRLSLPLFEQLAQRTASIEQELRNTLAHEMIHQWQFDVLKRRPNHGLDFLRKMTELNRSGDIAIATYHTLEQEVTALARFAWRCGDCGRLYRRQRNTIRPEHHHCGVCHGPLQALASPTPCQDHRSMTEHETTSASWKPPTTRRRFADSPMQLILRWL